MIVDEMVLIFCLIPIELFSLNFLGSLSRPLRTVYLAAGLIFLLSNYSLEPVFAQATLGDIAKGDGTCMGMEIKNVNNVEDGYSVVTTGAVFQIQKNRVQIFQRIAKSRKLALLQWSKSTNFKIIDRCSDHVVVQGDGLMVTIYGDSTCILHTASADTLRIQGEFLPEYIGRFGGELLLIDHYGGVQICSDRNRNNYPINAQCQANMPWQASYHLEKSERLMVAAFPERSFDWEKSFASNIIFTQAAQGRSYGKMPPKRLMRRWAENFQIMVIWHNGLYIPSNSGVTYAGPYDIADPIAFKEGIETAHCMGLKMIVYTSFYYFDEKHGNIDTYIEQIQKLKDNYGIDGVYIDGLLTEIDGHVHDQVFINWEIVRRLRKIFGQDGVIVYHGTAFGHAVATMPQVDTYCDATLNGENIPYKSFTDPYIRFQVKKYGISNTVALWKPGPGPYQDGDPMIVDAVLSMNGRIRYWSGVVGNQTTGKQAPTWIGDINQSYRYYLSRLHEKRVSLDGSMATDFYPSIISDYGTNHRTAGEAPANISVP